MAGYQVRTTDGVIGTSGSAKNIYGFTATAGGSNATIDIHDGTSTSGTKVITIVVPSSSSRTVSFGSSPVRFGSGCYINLDANTNAITTFYEEVV